METNMSMKYFIFASEKRDVKDITPIITLPKRIESPYEAMYQAAKQREAELVTDAFVQGVPLENKNDIAACNARGWSFHFGLAICEAPSDITYTLSKNGMMRAVPRGTENTKSNMKSIATYWGLVESEHK